MGLSLWWDLWCAHDCPDSIHQITKHLLSDVLIIQISVCPLLQCYLQTSKNELSTCKISLFVSATMLSKPSITLSKLAALSKLLTNEIMWKKRAKPSSYNLIFFSILNVCFFNFIVFFFLCIMVVSMSQKVRLSQGYVFFFRKHCFQHCWTVYLHFHADKAFSLWELSLWWFDACMTIHPSNYYPSVKLLSLCR